MAEQPMTLTPRMKRTLAHANHLAQARGHGYVGTEHMLLALLDDPEGIAGQVIHRLGFAAAIRNEIIRIIESDGYATSSRARCTRRGRPPAGPIG